MSTSSSSSDSFHGQLAAVIEVLANTAVAEICKLVDDGYAELRLEISQNQREIDGLRRKLLVAKFQTSRRNHLDRLSALRRSSSSSTVHVTRGPLVPSRARCNAVTKSSTQGTGGEEEDGGGGFPIILKVEGDSNTLKDIQSPVKQGSDTNTRASASIPSSGPISRNVAVEPENHLRRADQRFHAHAPPPSKAIASHHSNGNVSRESHHPTSDHNNRFTSTTSHDDGNLFTSASEWAEAGAGIELWNNTGNLTTGNCSLDPPHNSGPHQERRTRSNTDGREGSPGASEDGGRDVSGDPSNIAPSLAGDLDWEPDMVLVDSVPIKVEADMSSEWSIIDRDGITRSAKRRLQKDRRKEELEPARSAPTLSTQISEGTTGLKSSLLDINIASSCSDLSSFSSSFSSPIKTPRQVLHPQANRGDNHSSALNDMVASSARGEFSRLLSSIPPMALPAQRAHDAGGQPFRCELCGKTFGKFQSLRRHQRVHTGEKPFGCRHCSKRFSHQHQMKNHERVHTGEKPFRCPICGRCFVQSNHMKRHLSIHTAEDKSMR